MPSGLPLSFSFIKCLKISQIKLEKKVCFYANISANCSLLIVN